MAKDNNKVVMMTEKQFAELIACLPPKPLYDLLVAVVGSVDSGKSTLTGVLSKGRLDNGRGKARRFTNPLKHEVESGKTSNVNVVRVTIHGRKIVLIDLAGHEKYLKTTLKGLNLYFPDYAMLVVNAHKGILPMTREHMAICRSLNIPVFVVVTKVDDCPPDVLRETLSKTKSFCKSYGRRFGYNLNRLGEIQSYTRLMTQNTAVSAGVIKVSNVTGVGLEALKLLLALLPELPSTSSTITDYLKKKQIRQLFYVMTPFKVPGTGVVIYGRNYGEPVTKMTTAFLGPIDGRFIQVRVRTIENKTRERIESLGHAQLGSLAIKPTDSRITLTKDILKQGQILTYHAKMETFVARSFKASLFVHNTPTTIKQGYRPYINCGNVRTATRLEDGDKPFPLRIGDEAYAFFTLRMPSILYPEMPYVFRDGRVKASGRVGETLDRTETEVTLALVERINAVRVPMEAHKDGVLDYKRSVDAKKEQLRKAGKQCRVPQLLIDQWRAMKALNVRVSKLSHANPTPLDALAKEVPILRANWDNMFPTIEAEVKAMGEP